MSLVAKVSKPGYLYVYLSTIAGVPGVSGTATLRATKDNSTGQTTTYVTTSVGAGFALSYMPLFRTVEGNVSGAVRLALLVTMSKKEVSLGLV